MIGICLIATLKYKQFVVPLLEQIEKYFLPTHEKSVVLFQDGIRLASKKLMPIFHIDIAPLRFPYASMYRYRLFSQNEHLLKNFSHIVYTDVDMGFENIVGPEFLGDGLTAVIHPGFFNGGGSWETRPESKCYVPPEKRKKYYAGGVQAGRTDVYLKAAETMAAWIDEDEKNGIVPVWHDESAWNCYLSQQKDFIELDSGYCMVEQKHLRQQWGIDHLEPKIIALAKIHSEIRS